MKWAYYLSHPVAASVVFGLTMVLLSFIDAKVNSVDRTRNDYLKLFALVTGGTLAVLYFVGKRDSFKQLGGGVSVNNISEGHHRSHHSSHRSHGHSSGGHQGFDSLSAEVPDF